MANQFLEAWETCLGHMECHMLRISFALQLWDPGSNPIRVFFPPSIAGLLHWSRAKHPVLGEMRTQAGAGLFPTLPPYICFHILVTSCWRIKQEGEDSSLPRSPVFPQKPDEMWGHKERGETGSDMWKLLWKFPRKQKHKTIGLA